jgi:hypothetical protein
VVLIHHQVIQVQQKNMMDQLGHTSTSLNTARRCLAGAGTQTAGLAFGGNATATAATEEWTGAGAAVTKTITVS